MIRQIDDYLSGVGQATSKPQAVVNAGTTAQAILAGMQGQLAAGNYGGGPGQFRQLQFRLVGSLNRVQQGLLDNGATPENVQAFADARAEILKKFINPDFSTVFQTSPGVAADIKQQTAGVQAEIDKRTAGAKSDKERANIASLIIGAKANQLGLKYQQMFGMDPSKFTDMVETLKKALAGEYLPSGDAAADAMYNALNMGGTVAANQMAKVLNSFGFDFSVKPGPDGTLAITGKAHASSVRAAGSGGGHATGKSLHTLRDTATPRRQFAKSLAAHSMFDAAIPGSRSILSGLRNTGLGSPSSDHRFGYAYDLTGQNLGAYANLVKASGGFAEFHGGALDRHLHVVPPNGGDSSTSRRAMAAMGAAVSGTVNHSYSIVVNGASGQSAAAIADEVMVRIRRAQRDAAERS